MAGSRTSTRAPAGHSSVREGATRTTSLGSRVAYLSRLMQQLSRRPCWRHKSATQQIYTQNCRGVKTDDRLTMLFDGLERRGAFAAFVQETWRVGEEALEQQGCCFLGLGPEKQQGRGSLGLGIVLGRLAYAAWRHSGAVVHRDLGSHRVMAVRLEVQEQRRARGVFLLNGYAPVSSAPADEWDEYYDALSRGLARMRRGDLLIAGVDANASVGRGSLCVTPDTGAGDGSGAVGPHGIEHVNESGRRLRTWLELHELGTLSSHFTKNFYALRRSILGEWLETEADEQSSTSTRSARSGRGARCGHEDQTQWRLIWPGHRTSEL